MRISHRAGILSVAGWLLMTPPSMKQEGKMTPNSEAPLSEWHQDSAYDTARECEAARIVNFGGMKHEGRSDLADYYVNARCVPADQVYPSKKPGK